MSSINPSFLEQVAKIRDALNGLDYFQLLRLDYDATPQQIRDGYRRQARAFHPDRYNYLGSTELTQDLTIIARRISEAYVVLRNDRNREQYLSNIRGPERLTHLRFRECDEEQARTQQDAAHGTTRQGKALYAEATHAWEKGDKSKALNALKMALLYEKDNKGFSALLARWEAEVT